MVGHSNPLKRCQTVLGNLEVFYFVIFGEKNRTIGKKWYKYVFVEKTLKIELLGKLEINLEI
jgi:hypothetical protein